MFPHFYSSNGKYAIYISTVIVSKYTLHMQNFNSMYALPILSPEIG